MLPPGSTSSLTTNISSSLRATDNPNKVTVDQAISGTTIDKFSSFATGLMNNVNMSKTVTYESDLNHLIGSNNETLSTLVDLGIDDNSSWFTTDKVSFEANKISTFA